MKVLAGTSDYRIRFTRVSDNKGWVAGVYDVMLTRLSDRSDDWIGRVEKFADGWNPTHAHVGEGETAERCETRKQAAQALLASYNIPLVDVGMEP